MHNFHDILLPDFITIHLKGGPAYATTCASSISGREMRVHERQHAIQKYSLTGCRLSDEQFQIFNCFFRARMGKSFAFRIRDHADFCLEHQMIGIVDNISDHFEVVKTYSDGVSSYTRRIITLRTDTIRCNIPIKNIDHIHGIIYTNEPIAKKEPVYIGGEFDVAVRFCSDEFKYGICQDGSILLEDLELIEVIL